MAEDYAAMLRAFDDPVHWEQPPDFDRADAIRRFTETHRDLERALGAELESETGTLIQDASFHSQVRLGVYGDEIVVIRFSNFGDMVAISGEACLPHAVHILLEKKLREHGYLRIPEAFLGTYTGKNPGVTGIRSWWVRYFDWV